MDWWVNDLGHIISLVADGADTQPGKTIRCSSVALGGWADGVRQLYEALETARQDLKTCQDFYKYREETHKEFYTAVKRLRGYSVQNGTLARDDLVGVKRDAFMAVVDLL